MRRVVARADGVHVELLHPDQVGAGVLLVEDPAALGVRLVPVHPVEDDPAPVDEEPVAADLHGAEAEAQRDGLALGGDRGVVEPWGLGGPRLDRPDLDRGDVGGRLPDGLHAELGDAQDDREGGRARGDLGDERAGAVRERGAEPDVLQTVGAACAERHVAEDAGQPPLVLVLQVARRRPLVHAHGEKVPLGADLLGHIELVGEPAAARGADLHTVQPDPVERFDTVEAQHDAGVGGPPARKVEPAPVVACRVLVGHEGRLDRERVLHVGVDRAPVAAVAVQDPVRRDRKGVPAGVVQVGACDVVREVGGGGEPEPPVAVQRERRRVGVQPGAGRTESAGGGRGVGEKDGRRHDAPWMVTAVWKG